MKTIDEWFLELPEPYKSQAISNREEWRSALRDDAYKHKNDILKVLDIHAAISNGFSFPHSKEGWVYWHKARKINFELKSYNKYLKK